MKDREEKKGKNTPYNYSVVMVISNDNYSSGVIL